MVLYYYSLERIDTMETFTRINDNNYYCVVLRHNDKDQDVLETNYQLIADVLCSTINDSKKDFDILENSIGNMGTFLISDIITNYFNQILTICEALQPRECYVHIFANVQPEDSINSFDSTTPTPLHQDTKKYIDLMSLLIADLVCSCSLNDDLDEDKLNEMKIIANQLNTIFDMHYKSDTPEKS